MIVALTGFMASGKTTFGRAAAERLGLKFIDLDRTIEGRYGKVADIFKEHGEDFFRDMESRCLKEILYTGDDIVLALGGGTILNEKNRLMLRQNAKVIWLATSLEIILSELDNADRPLAKGRSAVEISELYEQRKPLYRQAADTVVTIDSFDFSVAVKDLSDAISALLNN